MSKNAPSSQQTQRYELAYRSVRRAAVEGSAISFVSGARRALREMANAEGIDIESLLHAVDYNIAVEQPAMPSSEV